MIFEELADDDVEDCSYTISLDMPTLDWISFHDWIPDFQFSNRNTLYSVLDNIIYTHNIGPNGYYYDSWYNFSITPVLVSPKQSLDYKQPFMLDNITIAGTIPLTSWQFNQFQTSKIVTWIPKDETIPLEDNYGVANAFFVDGRYQFNDFRNNSKGIPFLLNRLDRLDLLPNSTEDISFSNRIVGDHLIVKLTYGNVDFYFSEIGYGITWQL